MVSAEGLLCLAQFAQFTAIVALVRTFNRERLAALQEADRAEPKRRELLLQRARGLERQAATELDHAATVKNALSLEDLAILAGVVAIPTAISFSLNWELKSE